MSLSSFNCFSAIVFWCPARLSILENSRIEMQKINILFQYKVTSLVLRLVVLQGQILKII